MPGIRFSLRIDGVDERDLGVDDAGGTSDRHLTKSAPLRRHRGKERRRPVAGDEGDEQEPGDECDQQIEWHQLAPSSEC